MQENNTSNALQFAYKHSIDKNALKMVSTHSHNNFEMIFFLKGNANYLIEDKTYTLKKYDLIITCPAKYHNIDIVSNEEYERYVIGLEKCPKLEALLSQLSKDFEVVNCSNIPTILDCFKKIDIYYKHFPQEIFYELLNSLLIEICYNLTINESYSSQHFDSVSPIIQEALKYINGKLYTIKNVSEISDHLFVAKNYFFKLFREEMKISPKKYINTKRLLHAQMLLSHGEKPTLIYEKCGFTNYISFYKRYIDFFGYSPSQEKSKIKKSGNNLPLFIKKS